MKDPDDQATWNDHSGVSGSKFPRVDHLRKLLGYDTLLLAWPRGEKGTRKKWGHLTAAEMEKPAYLQTLEAGNIGVAQGAVSNGLCSIDFDIEDFTESFLELNPKLSETLITRGARGCNIWVRCVFDYPRSAKLKTKAGQNVGEWRSDGNQTIVSGTHPSGVEYRFLYEAVPTAIAFEEIAWPETLLPPKWKLPKKTSSSLLIEHSNTETQRTQRTQGTQVVGAAVALFDVTPFTPSERGHSDRLLFDMARRMKTWEKNNRRDPTAAELTAHFSAWWESARDNIDPSMDFYAYLSKWIGNCMSVKFADDQTPLNTAWQAANEQPLPHEATVTYGPEPMPRPMQLLVALCYHLQLAQGESPFFLGSRDAAGLMKIPHTTVFYWLRILSHDNGPFRILEKISTGDYTSRRTNEWGYRSLRH